MDLSLGAILLCIAFTRPLFSQATGILQDAEKVAISALAIDEEQGLVLTGVRKADRLTEPHAVARLWSLQAGRQLGVIKNDLPEHVESVAINSKKPFLAISGLTSEFFQDREVSLWSYGYLDEKNKTAVLTTERLEYWKGRSGYPTFSPDGEWLFIVGEDGIWKTATDSDLHLERFADIRCRPSVRPIFSNDGSELYVAGTTKTGANRLVAFDATTAEEKRRYPPADEDAPRSGLIVSCNSSPDGKFLATAQASRIAGKEDCVIVWDRNTGKEIRRFICNPHRVCFTSDSKHAVVITIGGQLLSWDIENGNPSKPTALGFEPRREYDRDQDITRCAVAELSSNGSLAVIVGPLKPNCIQADLWGIQDRTHLGTLVHAAEAKQWEVNIASVSIKPDTSFDDSAKAAQPLAAILASSATNGAAAPAGPRLFYLGIGVAKYHYDEYNLRFTGRDVEETAQFFRDQKPIAKYADVLVKELRDDEATCDHIRNELDWLGRSCSSQDVAIVQFCGHGMNARLGLYFMPHEADTESIGTTCLNWTEVVKQLDAVKAQRIIVILDCCHSGAFHANVPNQLAFAKALEANEAALILCASGADQSALESDDIKHGFFTFAMLTAMQGKGDANQDGTITVQEMFDYVQPEVRKMSANKQDAEIFKTQANTDVPIAFIPPPTGSSP